MQVSVEVTSGLERKMKVSVPEDRIEGEVTKRLQQLSKTARIDGFRKGKIPMSVVKQQFGGQVRSDVLGEVIQSTYYEAITSEKLNPAGMPTVEPVENESGEGFEYTATFEVMPEVTAASFDGVELEEQGAEVSDEDVDNMIKTLMSQRASWDEVERGAEQDDRAVIDFNGTIDGEEFQGNHGKDVPVTIGGKRMIEGFEEGLIGAKAGDELTLDLQFPEDYAFKEVAGKPVQFAVTVHKVEAASTPELDEEFVKSFGGEDGTEESLKKEIRANMERELSERIRSALKEQVMDKIIELNPIDIPQSMIESESQALMEQMSQNMYKPEGKGVDLDPKMFADQAKRRVSLGLIISEIIKANELTAPEDKVDERLQALAASYEQPEEVINYYKADKQRLSQIESLVLEEEVVNWALNSAAITKKESSFSEVMGQQHA